MRTMVNFRTDMFPDESEALERDEYLKPGKFLAEWLAERLRESGIPVASVGGEDWGWYVELEGDYGFLEVGCSKIDDTDDQWLCFTHEVGKFGRWFLRRKGKPGMAPTAIRAIAAILSAEARVHSIGWLSDTDPVGSEGAPDPAD